MKCKYGHVYMYIHVHLCYMWGPVASQPLLYSMLNSCRCEMWRQPRLATRYPVQSSTKQRNSQSARLYNLLLWFIVSVLVWFLNPFRQLGTLTITRVHQKVAVPLERPCNLAKPSLPSLLTSHRKSIWCYCPRFESFPTRIMSTHCFPEDAWRTLPACLLPMIMLH